MATPKTDILHSKCKIIIMLHAGLEDGLLHKVIMLLSARDFERRCQDGMVW